MIKLVRDNKEVRRTILFQTVLSFVFSGLFICVDLRLGAVSLVFSASMILVGLIGTLARYRKIGALAQDINRILHGERGISLEDYSEGELSVLHSEIYKMTVRLREQQQQLTEEKIYLADSIADITHQIRTPLTSVNLLIHLMSDSNMSAVRRNELTREMYNLISRMEWLITTLLKISRLDADAVEFKKETVSLKSLINRACSPLLVTMELKGIDLVVKASGDFFCDVAWTSEAIGNIVKNCVEHTPCGEKIEIEGRDNSLFTEITVSDGGSGIPQADLPHVFERFYKGSNSDDRSFGVGLALARMIITRQNGTVKAENRKNSGAKFTMRFYKGIV